MEEQTAAYTVEIWKRFRKWGGIPTGITVTVSRGLSPHSAAGINPAHAAPLFSLSAL